MAIRKSTRRQPSPCQAASELRPWTGAPAQAAVGGSRLDRIIETFDACCAAQDALRAELEEKLRPLSQERTIQAVAAAEGDADGR